LTIEVYEGSLEIYDPHLFLTYADVCLLAVQSNLGLLHPTCMPPRCVDITLRNVFILYDCNETTHFLHTVTYFPSKQNYIKKVRILKYIFTAWDHDSFQNISYQTLSSSGKEELHIRKPSSLIQSIFSEFRTEEGTISKPRGTTNRPILRSASLWSKAVTFRYWNICFKSKLN
jgi:hypothetical protein